MEEILLLRNKGKASWEFSVKHLSRLGKLLHFMLPSDTRRYYGRFLLKEGLLYTLFGSVLSLMPVHQADACWTDVVGAIQLVSRFVLEAGRYSANPISKMAAAVSGGVVPLLLGAIVHLDPSTTAYGAALSLLGLIDPYFLYRQVWEAARLYFPECWIDILIRPRFEELPAKAQQSWRSFQLSYHHATRYHTGGRSKFLTTHGCDNVKHNQWLPRSAKADVLAFVEDFWNYRSNIVKRAEGVLEIPANSHYVSKLNIDTLPPRLTLVPAPKYTQPTCKNPVFNSRMKTYAKKFLCKARHQLVEIRFSFGNGLNLALVDLQLTDEGAWKVNNGAFSF
ncbi:hypothetical protein H1R20_g1256, partial [Candolleomyces eurysporus]